MKKWIIDESKYSDSLLLCNYGLERILKAHYLLKQKRISELLPYLDFTKERYLQGNRYTAMIYIELLYSFVYQQTGDIDKAIHMFEKVYDRVKNNNLIMPIIEMGRLSRTLVNAVKKQNTSIPLEWLDMIQAKATTYRRRMKMLQHDYLNGRDNHRYQLSTREKELLNYLAQGLTHKEACYEMDLTMNTIKSMLKNIYAKLGATNINQAIYIALKEKYID